MFAEPVRNRLEPEGQSGAAARDRVQPRADLAAMLVPLGEAFTTAELPILRNHQLSMWAYIVLTALAEQPVRSQLQLASMIGADKTRIIKVLDDLEGRSLIVRERDPDDRRVHLLQLTSAGRSIWEQARTDIQQGEERVLSVLTPEDRDTFLRALSALIAIPRVQIETLNDAV